MQLPTDTKSYISYDLTVVAEEPKAIAYAKETRTKVISHYVQHLY